MSKVILQGYVLVPDDSIEAVLQALPEHILNTTAEQGCLVFNVQQDVDQPNKLSVYEEFVDKDAFDLHQERVKRSLWGKVSRHCERFYNIKGQ
jgi:quinol monooxygenase YgiN